LSSVRPLAKAGVQWIACRPLWTYDEAVIATSYRYIVRRAGVRSGHAIIEGTRIGVHDVIAMIRTGCTVDEVVASFPKLSRAQVYESLAYYEDHREQLEPLVTSQTAELDA